MSEGVSFVGGMNVPGALGRANATVPLAELIIDDRTLTLRPRGVGQWIMTNFEVGLDEIAAAFRLRGQVMTSGVGIRLRDGRVAYFWTYSKHDAVLTALSQRAVHVEPQPQRARGASGLRSHGGQAARPAPSESLQWLAPVSALAATAMLIVLLVIAEFWWMRVAYVAIWTVVMITMLRPWWSARRRPTT